MNYPDHQLVAEAFSRSAASYDAAAILQNYVGDMLWQQIRPQGICLDLGCGTGRYAGRFAQLTSVKQSYGLDIAPGMLAFARDQHADVRWLHSDALSIPLSDNSVDLIFSSLMVQWLGPSPALFNELKRVLKPGGTLAFSTLLEGTLQELKNAWQAVDNKQHVNQFETLRDWQHAAEKAGFTSIAWHQERCVREFNTVPAMLRELKDLGAHNVNTARPKGMMGKQRFMQFVKAYEQYRKNALLPASYEVLYGVLNA